MARPVRASDGAYRQLPARGSDRRDRQGGHASRRAKFRSVEARKVSQRPGLHRRRDQLPHRLPDEKSVSAHGPQAPHRRPEGVPVLGHAAFEKVAEHEIGRGAGSHRDCGISTLPGRTYVTLGAMKHTDVYLAFSLMSASNPELT